MKKIFISHSNKDIKIVKEIVKLLKLIGISSEEIFCTSVPGNGIILGSDNYLEVIKRELKDESLVLLILSENFYSSSTCLCEMGAAWIRGNIKIPILLKPLNFEDLKGVIPVTQGMKIDDKDGWNNLKEVIEKFFSKTTDWEDSRDEFLKFLVNNYKKEESSVDEEINDGKEESSVVEEIHYKKEESSLIKEVINGKNLEQDKEVYLYIKKVLQDFVARLKNMRDIRYYEKNFFYEVYQFLNEYETKSRDFIILDKKVNILKNRMIEALKNYEESFLTYTFPVDDMQVFFPELKSLNPQRYDDRLKEFTEKYLLFIKTYDNFIAECIFKYGDKGENRVTMMK